LEGGYINPKTKKIMVKITPTEKAPSVGVIGLVLAVFYNANRKSAICRRNWLGIGSILFPHIILNSFKYAL
jgi:hypothetical protein